MRPFRAIAVVLALIVAAEIYGITKTPTYSDELAVARAEYQAALDEHQALKNAVRAIHGGKPEGANNQ